MMPQVTEEDPRENVVKPTVDGHNGAASGLLDTFWALSDMKKDIREDAVVRLLSHLRLQNDKEEIDYCVNRLVRGLSSPHKAARLGFYTALVHLLRLFPVVTSVDQYVRLIRLHLHCKLSSFSPDQMAVDASLSHASIGLCLGYAALVRSRRLLEDVDVMKQIASELLAQCAQTETFRELCATLIVQLLDGIEEAVFKSVLWPSFRTHFEGGWEDCSCETLWIVLVCAQKYPHVLNKSYLKKVWGGRSSLLHVDSHRTIAKILMRSSSSHPRVHPLCSTALHTMSSSPEMLYDFWNIVTDLAFSKQQRKEKAYLTFELLKQLLEDAEIAAAASSSAEGVRRLLRPCFVRSLVQSMAHPQVVLHGAAAKLANVLVSFVSKTEDADVQLEVVKCLLLPPGSFSFDQVTHSSTISSMISSMKCDAVRSLISFLKDTFLEEEDATNEMHRSSALHLLSRTVGVSPIVRADVKMQLDILRFLALHAFFDHVGSESDIAECDRQPNRASVLLHNKARNCLFACIASLSAARGTTLNVKTPPADKLSAVSQRRRLHLDVLHDVFVYVDLLLQSPRAACPLLENSRQPQVRKAVSETLRVMKEIRATTADTDQSHAFQLLFAHLGIHLLFVDATDATLDALKDVHICYTKLSSRQIEESNEDEPDWILVIVDLLLSLLGASTSEIGRMRSVVNDVFALLVDPHLTVDALDHILDVLDTTNRGEDDDDDYDVVDDCGDDETTSTVEGEEEREEESSSSSSSSDDDEVVDANGCNGTLRDAVKAALGNAADDSEREDDGDDSDDVVLDDDAMMQLDETLAEAFRLAVVKKPSRPSQEDEARVHFRHRCFDLIEAVISCRPSVSLLLRLILPLVSTVESALKDKVQVSVGQKALACLRRLCRVKRFCDERAVESGGEKRTTKTSDNLGIILRDLVGRFRKVSDYGTSLVIAEACTFVVRCALRADQHTEQSDPRKRRRKRKVSDEAEMVEPKGSSSSSSSSCHVDECVEVYRQTLRDYFDNRERHTPHQMFTCLVKKYLLLGWQLADVLQSYAFRPEVRLFKRTRAVTMLCSLMSNSNLVVQVVGADHWSSVSDDIQLKIAESLETLTTNVKPRCVAEMLHLTTNVAILDRKYGRQLSEGSWSRILDAVERLSLIEDLPKDARKRIKRVRTLLSQQNETKTSRRANKKLKKDQENA